MFYPTDFSAVESDQYSYLFYVRDNKTIAFLKSNTTQEGNDTVYKSSSVIVDGNAANTGAPKISAVAYTKDGRREVRLYFVAPKSNGKGFLLNELCRTNEGDWYPGALNKNNISCSETSLVSANVEYGKGDLKVFFMDTDGTPGVAWVTLGQTAWAQHLLDDSKLKW